MLQYTFSRREKVLMAVLAVVLVGLSWYLFVFKYVNDQISLADAQIANLQTEAIIDQGRLDELNNWRQVIEERKAQGVVPTEVPDYDNLRNVMAELNGILAATNGYALQFDEVDLEAEGAYVQRGVTITYGVGSYDEAKAIITALERGQYPCTVDSFTISDNTASRSTGVRSTGAFRSSDAPFSATAHVVFFEQRTY